MTPQEGVDEEDRFKYLFESALEEERSQSKTLSLPDTSNQCSNVCLVGSSRSLSCDSSGMGSQGSGDASMVVEQADESMRRDWARLLLRIRDAAVKQASASVGCVQADNGKLAGEDVDRGHCHAANVNLKKCKDPRNNV